MKNNNNIQVADVIGKHVRAIFKEGELLKDSVWAKFAYTASDGKEYQVDYYNLDVIISVGYRVKSVQGTKFRIWRLQSCIYTVGIGLGMQRLMDEHDRLFPDAHVDIRKWSKESHDRWLIIDDTLYHCGHSLNANGGHKISAITRMGTSPEEILSIVENGE